MKEMSAADRDEPGYGVGSQIVSRELY